MNNAMSPLHADILNTHTLDTNTLDIVSLIDTHTHFDNAKFDDDRLAQLQLAESVGIRHLVITGITTDGFAKIVQTQQQLNQVNTCVQTHIAFGLHPFLLSNITRRI